MNKQILEVIYGPRCSSDYAFTSRARFLQSWYRVNVLKQSDFGFGPEENSKTKYGNILVDGQKTGMNFLSREIFKYAQFRTQFLKSGETIKEYRLYNNMLSSQPMCFNLFYPLKKLFEQDYEFSIIDIQGSILSTDLLAKIRSEQATFQQGKDFNPDLTNH
jgi:hypothetical protein